MYRNVIPYTPEILATLTGHQVGTVEKALDVFKNGILLPVLNYQGEAGTHSEFVEGLMAYDIELTMNNIIRQVFEEGRYILTKAREERIASLPAEPMTEADFELRRNLGRLNPEQDFSFWINLQDTNFRGKSELKELYESMFAEELEQCENLTGYPIEW